MGFLLIGQDWSFHLLPVPCYMFHEPMDELLLIDKPTGMTSHDVVDCIRRIFKTRAVGHAGTLDPMATGLLIVGVGRATKKLTALIGLDKTYEAEVMLGATSNTFDAEGQITPTNLVVSQPTHQKIEETLNQFRGTFEQKAPLFSAKKIKGKKLYDLARAGTATEDMRPSKKITIYSLIITDYSFPKLTLNVSCSSGTYIRSLADDIGRLLGTGAYLSGLRRTNIGSFDIAQAKSLNQLSVSLDNPDQK